MLKKLIKLWKTEKLRENMLGGELYREVNDGKSSAFLKRALNVLKDGKKISVFKTLSSNYVLLSYEDIDLLNKDFEKMQAYLGITEDNKIVKN
jgi:hypothetical protein